MRRIVGGAALLFLLLIAGCGAVQENTEILKQENIEDSMEDEPEIGYEVPESIPGILVNQLGYLPESSKMAVFRGEEIPGEFHVVREENGEVVYTGYSENKGYNEESQEYNGYGDFSEVCESGVYYIEAPILGRSYSFRVEEGLYDEVFREACRQYYYRRCGMELTESCAGERAHGACHESRAFLREDASVQVDVSGGWHQDGQGNRMVVPAAEDMAVTLMAYELYADAFGDDLTVPESGNGVPDILDELRYETDWLFKMQKEESGEVYRGVAVEQRGERAGTLYVETADAESAFAFAAVMSGFGYNYRNYDEEYSDRCIETAEAAFACADKSPEEGEQWRFAAAAGLYRATGNKRYHQYVLDYLSEEKYKEKLNEIIFWGCVTYISTREPVSLDLCEKITRVLMSRAEESAAGARSSVYLTKGNELQDNAGELLQDMMYLTMIDHMITNHEYETVIENHLHYFMGRNRLARSYIEGVGEWNHNSPGENAGIMENPGENSRLIFMLSEIVSSHSK